MRANTRNTDIDWTGVMITLVVLGVVAFVGINVMNAAISPEQLEQVEEVEHTCLGFFGCDGPDAMDLLSLFTITALVILTTGIMSIVGGNSLESTNDDRDRLTIVKERYVDGEIQTTVKLEQELEQTLDPDIDDATIDEIDDLLGRDNK